MIELAKLFRLYILAKRTFDQAPRDNRKEELVALKRAERAVLNTVKDILKIREITDEPNV